MSRLVSDLIAEAAEMAYGLAQGAAPNASELARMFSILNYGVIPLLKPDPLMSYGETTITKTLSAGTQSYTLGTGGDINTTRPVFIKPTAKARLSGFEHDVVYTTKRSDWAKIPEYTTALVPRIVFDDCGYPLRTLRINPKTSGTPDLELYALLSIEPYAATDTAVDLPPGYDRMLVLKLARATAKHFGAQLLPDLLDELREAEAVIRASNGALMGIQLPQPAAQGA